MDSESQENAWETALTLLFRPRLLLQGVVEYGLAWSFTRGWWRLLLIHFLTLALLLCGAGLVAYGVSLSRRTLVERYGELVAAELPEALRQLDEDSPTVASGKEKTAEADSASVSEGEPQDSSPKITQDKPAEKVVSQYGELLLRRLLQLQDSNSRIIYLVAGQLARQDRVGQSRQLMRRIASEDSAGFPPAHAWLAIDQLRGGAPRSQEDRDRLIHDLGLATRWAGCPAGLIALYAELLEAQGKTNEAMAMLERAGAKESTLLANLKIAEIAIKHDQQGRLDRAAEAIGQEITALRDSGKLAASDLAVQANLYLILNEPQLARESAQEGLGKKPGDPQLLRLLSESYRLGYLQSVRREGGQTQVNLSLLDAALKADPTNPGVGTEIARLINLGQEAPPELQAALEQQLAAGRSTALTHVLLANRALIANDLVAAEPHLELALRQAPNNPTIMNNLGLVLARTKPEQMERAIEMVTGACRIAPTNGQFRDTLGEIRSLSGDQLGAVEAYEAAIGLEPNLVSARKKLTELYSQLGMSDMAAVQQRELEKLLHPQQPPDDSPSPDNSPSPENLN